MLCLSIALSCPGFVLTTILSLSFILSGPYSAKTALQSLKLPHSYANMPSELSNCSVFLSSQCRAHKFTSHSSSSRRKSKSSLNPFHLKQIYKKVKFSFYLIPKPTDQFLLETGKQKLKCPNVRFKQTLQVKCCK